MNNIIKIKELKKSFGNEEILKGISLDLPEGKFTAIMGPSGAGKSTFLNIISGLEKPTSGFVEINGTKINELVEPELTIFRRDTIGYIFQQYNLIDFLNIYDNIVLPLKISKVKFDTKVVSKVIDSVGLNDQVKKFPDELSGGQKQRAAIARSIVGNNSIIFADEPTGALDVQNKDKVIKLLMNMVKENKKTLVLVTHDPLVAELADEVIFLLNGKIFERTSGLTSKQISSKLEGLEKNA